MDGGCPYNNSRNTLSRVAASLQVLGDDGEDARGESHVEQTMCLFSSILKLLYSRVQTCETSLYGASVWPWVCRVGGKESSSRGLTTWVLSNTISEAVKCHQTRPLGDRRTLK